MKRVLKMKCWLKLGDQCKQTVLLAQRVGNIVLPKRRPSCRSLVFELSLCSGLCLALIHLLIFCRYLTLPSLENTSQTCVPLPDIQDGVRSDYDRVRTTS